MLKHPQNDIAGTRLERKLHSGLFQTCQSLKPNWWIPRKTRQYIAKSWRELECLELSSRVWNSIINCLTAARQRGCASIVSNASHSEYSMSIFNMSIVDWTQTQTAIYWHHWNTPCSAAWPVYTGYLVKQCPITIILADIFLEDVGLKSAADPRGGARGRSPPRLGPNFFHSAT